MIEMQYNFPLLAPQMKQWKERLSASVAAMHVDDSNILRPSYRNDQRPLREAAARWIGSTPETTWLACSGHHGMLLALLAAGLPGKTIAVEGVTYGGILHQAKFLGCPLAAVEFDNEGMTPDSLRLVCVREKPVALFTMPTVHNPLGCTTSLARREAIVAIAREFDLLILEDDAYSYLDPDAPASYRVLAPERTFYTRGLSKFYCPATRTAFLVAPDRFGPAIDLALMNTASGTSLVHNAAAITLVEDGSVQAVMDSKLIEGARRSAAAREILGTAAAPGAKSAWHLWVTLPPGMDSPTAQRLCEQRGVLVSGGHGFAAPGITANGLRIALGGELDFDRTIEGVHLVAEVIRPRI